MTITNFDDIFSPSLLFTGTKKLSHSCHFLARLNGLDRWACPIALSTFLITGISSVFEISSPMPLFHGYWYHSKTYMTSSMISKYWNIQSKIVPFIYHTICQSVTHFVGYALRLSNWTSTSSLNPTYWRSKISFCTDKSLRIGDFFPLITFITSFNGSIVGGTCITWFEVVKYCRGYSLTLWKHIDDSTWTSIWSGIDVLSES